MEKILTIVIPSYNTEKFVDKNIVTFIASKYFDNLDIIFVNDGSKDNTAKVVQKYVDLYPQSIRLVNKENGGHGSTINVGIQEAKGKYFKVVDGDDYVDTVELDKLLTEIRDINVDVVMANFNFVSAVTGEKRLQTPDYSVIAKSDFVERRKILPLEDVLPKVQGCFHINYYRTDLLKENKEIKLSEHTFYEDTEYYLFPMAYAKTIYVSDCNVYQYLVDQATQSCSAENFQRRVDEHGKVMLGLAKFYSRHFGNAHRNVKDYAVRSIAMHVLTQYAIHVSFKENYRLHAKCMKDFDRDLKACSQEIYDFSNRYPAIFLVRKSNYILFPLLCFIKHNNGLRSIFCIINRGIRKVIGV